jgi:hypothetical protein
MLSNRETTVKTVGLSEHWSRNSPAKQPNFETQYDEFDQVHPEGARDDGDAVAVISFPSLRKFSLYSGVLI